MATNFITSSVSWDGKQTFDHFIKPLFIGKKPWETQGIRVIPNIKSSQKLNYFGSASKVLKAYAKGFNAAAGSTYTQRTITTYRMKAEMSSDGIDFYQTVYEYALRTDDWNNLQGTILRRILTEIFTDAVKSDIYREFWLNDTNKETLTSGVIDGTADVDYNSFDGMWKILMDDAATSPSATQIKRVAFTNGATAQVDTVTLTGTSGTCNVDIGGVDYLATFATSIAVTSAAFVALHAAALALRGITLTGATTLIFTSAIAGQPTPTPVPSAAVSGDLTGTNAATTANVDADELASGESEDMLLAIYKGADVVLRNLPDNEKIFLVSDSVYQNYQEYLETMGTEKSHTVLVEGVTMLSYRGIALSNLQWDEHLETDFPHNTSENPGYPHRIIYTHIYNLVLGIDSMNQYNGMREWFNEDEEENRFRMKLVMGVQYVHNKLTAIAY